MLESFQGVRRNLYITLYDTSVLIRMTVNINHVIIHTFLTTLSTTVLLSAHGL